MMHNMQNKYAQNMQKICTICKEIRNKCATNIQKNMHKICTKYAKYANKNAQYAKNICTIIPQYAKKYARNMHPMHNMQKICTICKKSWRSWSLARLGVRLVQGRRRDSVPTAEWVHWAPDPKFSAADTAVWSDWVLAAPRRPPAWLSGWRRHSCTQGWLRADGPGGVISNTS